MQLMKYLYLLPLFFACSFIKSGSVMERISSNKDASIKKIQTNSEKDAKNWIQNQINFLAMIYQQSRDPYYGVPKWSEECLKENKIGDISKTENGLQAISEIYLNQDGMPGFCSTSQNAHRSLIIYLFCENQDHVLEIKVPWSPEYTNLPENLCL